MFSPLGRVETKHALEHEAVALLASRSNNDHGHLHLGQPSHHGTHQRHSLMSHHIPARRPSSLKSIQASSQIRNWACNSQAIEGRLSPEHHVNRRSRKKIFRPLAQGEARRTSTPSPKPSCRSLKELNYSRVVDDILWQPSRDEGGHGHPKFSVSCSRRNRESSPGQPPKGGAAISAEAVALRACCSMGWITCRFGAHAEVSATGRVLLQLLREARRSEIFFQGSRRRPAQ